MTALLNSLFASLSPLWEMSLTAAYAAAIVALLRLVLKKRAPRQVLCLLWLVVFARLLIPASFESPLSIVPDGTQVERVQDLPSKLMGEGQGAPAQNPVQAQGQSGGAAPGPAAQGNANPEPVLTAPNGVTPSTSQAGPQAGFPWQAVPAAVWLAGALAMCLYGLFSYLSLKRRLFDAIRAQDGAWEHPSVSSPFILGVLRPRIYLPAGLCGRPRQFILCHERAHLRRRDHIVKPVCWLALALHWFNPFVWMAFILMSRDIEAACDEAVIRRLGSRIKADYSQTLLSLATNGRIPAPCPLAFGEGDARGRIKNVLRYRRPALWIVVVSVIMAVMAAVCLLTDPVSAQAPEGGPDPSASVSQDPGPSQPPEVDAVADPWMIGVLEGRQSFTSMERGEAVNIGLLNGAYPPDVPFTAITLSKLAIVDLDRDGINELILWPSIDGDDSLERISSLGYLVLHRTGDDVYVCNPSYRAFSQIKTDGTFYFSGSASHSGYASLRFSDVDFDINEITLCSNIYDDKNELKEAYFVDGRSATREEFDAAIAAQNAKPDVTWYVFEDGRLKEASANAPASLDGYDSGLSTPDFLDGEQLIAYYQAYIVYSHFFGPSTEDVDPNGYGSGSRVEYNGAYYWPATGAYANWDDFEAVIRSAFTETFWNERNKNIYVNLGGTMHYKDVARGGGGYNENFPETFRLVEQTDDAVSFIMTGYYSDDRQFEGITDEQREAWLAAGWEYSIEFPMRMVKTEDGWRFDEFHNARTDNGILEFGAKQVANPNAPAPPSAPGPSAAPEPSQSLSAAPVACEHGLDSISLDVVGGQLVARCTEDGHVYQVPGVTPDEWDGQTGTSDGGGWLREDLDGDGRVEIFVFVTSRETINAAMNNRIVSLDVEGGELVANTFRLQTLVDDFSQNSGYQIDYDNKTMAVSYRGYTKQIAIDDGDWSFMLNRGGGYAPELWPTDMWITCTGGSLVCGFPVHNSRSIPQNMSDITAVWSISYSAGGGFYASFSPGSWT